MSISNISYTFISLLPATESLAIQGARLQDTALERQSKLYAPDILPTIEVEEGDRRLDVVPIDSPLGLAHGERKRISVTVVNTGSRDIDELWMIQGTEEELWLDHSDLANTGKQ